MQAFLLVLGTEIRWYDLKTQTLSLMKTQGFFPSYPIIYQFQISLSS